MSINRQLNLARTRTGRVVLHLLAWKTDRKHRWHAAGIFRELYRIQANEYRYAHVYNMATTLNTEVSSACFVCQKPIVDSQWFCRVPQKNGTPYSETKKIMLCSPSGAFRYFAFSEIGTSQV